jgi:hypothetical protein
MENVSYNIKWQPEANLFFKLELEPKKYQPAA